MNPIFATKSRRDIYVPLLILSMFFGTFLNAQSTNDGICNPVNLVSSTTCVTTAGNLIGADSYSGFAGSCSSTRDVWYTFTAVSSSHTVTVSGGTLSQQRVQVFNGACPSVSNSISCGNSPRTLTDLSIGQSYTIRVYSNNAGNTGTFNICVTHPPPPANDLCTGATSINSNNSCINTGGTLLNATATPSVPGDCGAAGAADVWYRYTATTPFPNITLSSVGSDLNAAGARIQLLSGTCGALTSLACFNWTTTTPTLNTAATVGGLGLTVGNTYYIRVYSNTNTQTGSNWAYNICVTNPSTTAPLLDYSKSYVNITKGTNGGTIEPNDELEIRATFVVRSNTAYECTFDDAIPTNTTYIPGTLRILTNEGKTFRQWTDAADGDPAYISGGGVKINLGNGATQTHGGPIRNTDKPSVFGGTCVLMASYRVRVDMVPYITVLLLGYGSVSYKTQPTAALTTINFPAINGVVYKSEGICANTIGNNGINSEFGGTFGNGNTKDRAASNKVPVNYLYTPFTTGEPGDYKYGISNNTSANTTTGYSINPAETNNAKRVFSVWDIIGDHTGATDPLQGNLPADVNSGQSGGYMVVINAAYRTDTAFLDTIRNLCPNTSYEYSAWFRNICKKCGCDSNGVGSSGVGYLPSGPGDSSGVRPNLTFNINGYDFYTTGDIPYTGQWIKKGFTYRTGPAETEMIINIRNNAPGGGGNDWAIDDINVATCTPNLKILPGPTTDVCYGNQVDIFSEIKSYYDNYIYAQWEVSTNGGLTWTNTGGVETLNYVYNGTEYVDTTYLPSFIGDSSRHNNIYRVRVASTLANLTDPNCSFVASTTIVIYVNNCTEVLPVKILNVNGRLKNNYAEINWSTANETKHTFFEVQKSAGNSDFKTIGRLDAIYGENAGGHYSFTDPAVLTEPAHYRIRMSENNSNAYKFSRQVLLHPGKQSFEVKQLENPVQDIIRFSLVAPQSGLALIDLFDDFGRKLFQQQLPVQVGNTDVQLPKSIVLNNGTYILRVQFNNESIHKKLIKINR